MDKDPKEMRITLRGDQFIMLLGAARCFRNQLRRKGIALEDFDAIIDEIDERVSSPGPIWDSEAEKKGRDPVAEWGILSDHLAHRMIEDQKRRVN